MTEKVFIYNKCIDDGFYDIINTENNYTYPIGDMEVFVMGIVDLLNELYGEKEQLKQVAEEFVENPTQHNLWKLRTVLKIGDV